MQDPQKTVMISRAKASPAAAGQRPAGGRRPRGRRAALHFAVAGFALVAAGVFAGMRLLAPGGLETDANELARFSEHTAGVARLALSADGETAASEDQSGAVRIWRTAARLETGSLAVSAPDARCLALSGDGHRVAAGGLDGVALWDDSKPGELLRLGAADAPLKRPSLSVAFYPAQSHLLVGGRNEIVLWRLGAGQPVRRYATAGDVSALVFLPDGSRFLAGDSRGVIRLWDTHLERELAHCQAHAGPVRAIALDLSGSRLASCGDDLALRLWNVDELASLREFGASAEQHDPRSVAISAGGGRVLSGDANGCLRLWSCETGELLETYQAHRAAATCCAFFPNGLVAISGSLDHTVRLGRLPGPTEFEVKRIAAAIETCRRWSERTRQFAERFELAQQAIEERRLDDALVELREAAGLLSADTLEGAQVRDAIHKIESARSAEHEYRLHCEAGQAAAEREDYAEALRHFEAAEAINRDQPEAQRGAELASRALRLQRSLKGARLVKSELEFAERLSAPIPLVENESVAFLLTSTDAPMASPHTALAWKARIDLPGPFPDEQAALRIEFFDTQTGVRLAQSAAPLVPGQKEQALAGQAPAPEGGWRAGRYTMRASLVASHRVAPTGEPQAFSIGLIHWRKTVVDVTPSAVADARFSLDTGVTLEHGDGFALRASGTVAPAPVSFYRDLLDNPKLVEAVPSKPAGLPWSTNDQRLRKYRLVEAGANYATLLIRIDGLEWIPYVMNTAPLPAPHSGPIQLSINSIMPPRFAGADNRDAISGSREYWRPDCGKYEVTMFVGRFDFPDSLSLVPRAALLTRFSHEGAGAPAADATRSHSQAKGIR